MAFPGSIAHRVGTDRPEIRPAADELAIAQDDHAAVTAFDAVEHVDVDGIKPVLHEGCRCPFVLFQRLYLPDRRQEAPSKRPFQLSPLPCGGRAAVPRARGYKPQGAISR